MAARIFDRPGSGQLTNQLKAAWTAPDAAIAALRATDVTIAL
jgi:hypothetical protein